MADDRRIVIELKNISGDDTAASKTNDTAEKNSKDLQKVVQTLFHPIKTLEKETIGRNAVVAYAFGEAKQIVLTAARYQLNKYFTLREDYEGEVDFTNMMTTITKVTGFATTVGAGALVGAKTGTVTGTLIGAGIGATGYVVKEIYAAKERRLQQEITINSNNAQSQFQQTRLGLTTGRGVTNQ